MSSYAECHMLALYAEWRYAECYYAECGYAECRSAKYKSISGTIVWKKDIFTKVNITPKPHNINETVWKGCFINCRSNFLLNFRWIEVFYNFILHSSKTVNTNKKYIGAIMILYHSVVAKHQSLCSTKRNSTPKVTSVFTSMLCESRSW